jgi:hypothetical protein
MRIFTVAGISFVISANSSRRNSNLGWASTWQITPYKFPRHRLLLLEPPLFFWSESPFFTVVLMISKTALFALLTALSVISPVAALSDVLDLTAADFDETLAANPLVLAEFFAPWVRRLLGLF